MVTRVIAAFPGTGKTWMFDHQDEFNLIISDSDSSKFSWSSPGVRHEDFPNNYIQHIISKIGMVDVIFISTHKDVRDALKEASIDYTLIYPERDEKQFYIQRFQNRGSTDAFIKLVGDKWDEWMDELDAEQFPFKVKLSGHQFIKDIL